MIDEGISGNADAVRPAPRRSGQWRSPVRGPWLTSVFGLVLLIGIPIEFITGLLSYAAYNPKLGKNDPNPAHGVLGFYLFSWGPSPTWAYHLIESLHVTLGFALVPVLIAKLWSVLPKLFAWPPVRSIAHLLERLALVLLVGGAVFQFSTGILNIEYYGVYRFSFYTGHFYGAWIFLAGFVVHAVLRGPRMVRALRSRRMRDELRTGLSGTTPERADGGLVASDPTPPTISRRGVLGLVGGTSLAVLAVTIGDTVGGPLRRFAVLGTRNQSPDAGPNHFPVNHTAASVGITTDATGADWRLEIVGARRVALTRDQLLRLPQTTARLSITCTEGWSTTQRWTGVALRDLAKLCGVSRPASAVVDSLDGHAVTFAGAQAADRRALVALRVNGADLSLDHGYPARVVVPSTPGNYNRKWLRRIVFTDEPGRG